ncbi:MAG: hypothetical protein JST35_10600 [Armatimonadetes bacterium]|nr:hypothetical protein [Armatimonadota bacterium]
MSSSRVFSIRCERPSGASFEFRVAPEGRIGVYLVRESETRVHLTDPTSFHNVVMGYAFETPDGLGGRLALQIQDGVIVVDHRDAKKEQSVARMSAVEFGRRIQGLGAAFVL